MQNVEVARTRSFALIGHSADGKTSLGEALLHVARLVFQIEDHLVCHSLMKLVGVDVSAKDPPSLK